MARVLVIDDQADVLAVVCLALRVKGFDVTGVRSGSAALQEIAAERFDVAVVDIFLDGTSGIDVIAALRDIVPSLPIVAISGMAQFDFSGPGGWTNIVSLQKPFRPVQLIDAVRSLIDGPLEQNDAGDRLE